MGRSFRIALLVSCFDTILLIGAASAGRLPGDAEERRAEKFVAVEVRAGDGAVATRWYLRNPTRGIDERTLGDGGGSDESATESWVVGPNTRVDDTQNQAFTPRIAADRYGRLAATWVDLVGDEGRLQFAYSLDQGATWSPRESLDTDQLVANGPGEVEFAPNGEIVVVWASSIYGAPPVIRFRKRSSLDGPAIWTEPVTIQEAYHAYGAQTPSVVVLDDSRYLVAWADYRGYPHNEVYFKRTDDGGETWSSEVQVSDGPGVQSGELPSLVVADDTHGHGREKLYCLTTDWRGSGQQYPNVYGYASSTGGATWTAGTRVNDHEAGYQLNNQHAIVRMPSGGLLAVWYEEVNLPEIRSGVLAELGGVWSPSVRVDSDGGKTAYGTETLSCGEGGVVVAYSWEKFNLSNRQLCLRNLGPTGWPSWSSQVRITDEPEFSYYPRDPACVVVEGGVSTIWSDYRLDNRLHAYGARAQRVASEVEGSSASTLKRQLLVVPNPSGPTGSSSVWLSPALEMSPASIELRVLDATGRMVVSPGSLQCAANGRVGLPSVPAGVYWISVARHGRELARGKWCVVK